VGSHQIPSVRRTAGVGSSYGRDVCRPKGDRDILSKGHTGKARRRFPASRPGVVPRRDLRITLDGRGTYKPHDSEAPTVTVTWEGDTPSPSRILQDARGGPSRVDEGHTRTGATHDGQSGRYGGRHRPRSRRRTASMSTHRTRQR